MCDQSEMLPAVWPLHRTVLVGTDWKIFCSKDGQMNQRQPLNGDVSAGAPGVCADNEVAQAIWIQ